VGTRLSSRINKLSGHKVADRDSIQAVCDNAQTRKLMSWLDTVLTDETLTEAEVDKWNEIREEEDCFSVEENRLPVLRDNKEALEGEIALLKDKLEKSQGQEKVLSQQFSLLSAQSKECREETGRISAQVKANQDLSMSVTAASRVLQHKFDSQIVSLTEAITANLALQDKHNNEAAVFLSHLTLDGFTEAELQFTKALDEFGEKLFFSGIASVPGDPKECKLITLNESEDKENKPQNKTNNQTLVHSYQHARETMKQVTTTYVNRVSANIAEEVTMKSVKNTISGLKTILGDLKAGRYSAEDGARAEGVSVQCVKKECQVKIMWEKEGLELITQLRDLQDSPILVGNYCQKLARQNYFMSRQTMFIEQLVTQISRHELMVNLLKSELATHSTTVDRLSELLVQIKGFVSEMKRQNALVEGDDAILPLKADRLCIGANETTLTTAIQLLGDAVVSDSKRMFYTHSELLEGLEGVHCGEETREAARGTLDSSVELIHTNLTRCSTMLEKGLATSAREERKLLAVLEELEPCVTGLWEDYNAKSQQATVDEMINTGRELFVHFYTNPDKLFEVLNNQLTI